MSETKVTIRNVRMSECEGGLVKILASNKSSGFTFHVLIALTLDGDV